MLTTEYIESIIASSSSEELNVRVVELNTQEDENKFLTYLKDECFVPHKIVVEMMQDALLDTNIEIYQRHKFSLAPDTVYLLNISKRKIYLI